VLNITVDVFNVNVIRAVSPVLRLDLSLVIVPVMVVDPSVYKSTNG
jgi:hypothetical protein